MIVSRIQMNIWDYLDRPGYAILITTNGNIRSNGSAVMGAGIALEATKRVKGIDIVYGKLLSANGNNVQYITSNVWSFPTKHNFYSVSDLQLIRKSAQQLEAIARTNLDTMFILPKPGIGLGKLDWHSVRRVLASEIQSQNVLVI